MEDRQPSYLIYIKNTHGFHNKYNWMVYYKYIIKFEEDIQMEKKNISYLWLIPIIIMFPLIQIMVFTLRFNRLPDDVLNSSLAFIPLGLVSGIIMIILLNYVDSKKKRKSIIIGFLVATPISIVISLLAGLIAPSIVATTLIGTIPLLIGILAGYLIK